MIKNPPLAVSDYGEMMLTGRSKNLENKTHKKTSWNKSKFTAEKYIKFSFCISLRE